MKRLFLAFALLALIFTSCNKVQPFGIIYVTDNADLTIVTGDYAVTSTDGSVVDYTVSNGTLTISGNSNAKVAIPDPGLITAIKADSNATITSNEVLNVNKVFAIDARGNADVELSLTTGTLAINLDDDATLVINADTCTNVTLNANGNSTLNAFSLIAKNYVINVTGTADAEIYASSSISGKVSDEADVKYKGNPQDVNVVVDETATFIPASK